MRRDCCEHIASTQVHERNKEAEDRGICQLKETAHKSYQDDLSQWCIAISDELNQVMNMSRSEDERCREYDSLRRHFSQKVQGYDQRSEHPFFSPWRHDIVPQTSQIGEELFSESREVP